MQFGQVRQSSTLNPASILILVLVYALLWFGTLNYRHLIPSDEGRYAEIAREMLVTGDWVTPRYNGYKYFEKPPLQIWATATAFNLFGIGDSIGPHQRLCPCLKCDARLGHMRGHIGQTPESLQGLAAAG